MFSFLRRYDRTVAEWGTFLAVIVAIVGMRFTYAQLEQTNDHKRWQNYNELNIRYAELYKELPNGIPSNERLEFEQRHPDSKRWARQYFDLYSEEFWLYKNNMIPAEMWTRRIYGGVRVNLSTYPALIDGYYYWRNKGSFKHPDDFYDEVAMAIADAKELIVPVNVVQKTLPE